jgi:hypothetical protein
MVVAYGLISSVPEIGEVELRLDARSSNGPISFAIPLRLTDAREGKLIGTLAAKALLRDLEEGSSYLHGRGSLQERGGNDRVKNEAVRIGVKYGLTSRWTSFVAVEKRESKVEGPLELRRIPVALTRDWGGLNAHRGPHFTFAVPAASALDTGSFVLGAAAPDEVDASEKAIRSSASAAPTLGSRLKRAFRLPEPAVSAGASERALDRLVRLQRADGSWELDGELAKILGQRLKDLERVLTDASRPATEARRAWATALALAWLEKEAPEARDEWRLLAEKARKWLERTPARLASGEDWLTSAKRFLG